MKIKRLTKEDAKESVATGLWEAASSGFQEDAPWTVPQLLDLIASDSAIVVATFLEEDGQEKIVGVLVASKTTVESDVYMVAVREEYKRQGIGQQLFHYFISYCQEAGLETIFLEVRESNTPAYNLYTSLGFQEIGRRRSYYSQPIEDALMMKFDL